MDTVSGTGPNVALDINAQTIGQARGNLGEN
jgi:hypothetical protein